MAQREVKHRSEGTCLIIVLVMNIESQPSLIYDPRAASRKQAS